LALSRHAPPRQLCLLDFFREKNSTTSLGRRNLEGAQFALWLPAVVVTCSDISFFFGVAFFEGFSLLRRHRRICQSEHPFATARDDREGIPKLSVRHIVSSLREFFPGYPANFSSPRLLFFWVWGSHDQLLYTRALLEVSEIARRLSHRIVGPSVPWSGFPPSCFCNPLSSRLARLGLYLVSNIGPATQTFETQIGSSTRAPSSGVFFFLCTLL